MSTHESWALICSLFADGIPVFQSSLTPVEREVCASLGAAIKPTVINRTSLLCPYCQLESGLLLRDAENHTVCHCPDCGIVKVRPEDLAAIALDESWLHRKLRVALNIESRDGVTQLDDGVWRLGDIRREPVILARSVLRVATAPALLDRVRVSGGGIRVITPRERGLRHAPFAHDVTWLPLEERFALYGSGISFIEPPTPDRASEPLSVDLCTPIHGPFSANFEWVTLKDRKDRPIDLTDGQARMFKVLWDCKGKPIHRDRLIARANLPQDSKPVDAFKVRARNKHSEIHHERLRAYRMLVHTTKQGEYSLPCAADKLALD